MANGPTICVTGGSGFIGSAVIRAGLEAGHKIVNIDSLTYAALPGTLADADDHPHYHFEKVDICDHAAISAVLARYEPHGIMHLAAESHVDRSIEGPQAFLRTNVMGTAALLQAANDYWQAQDKPGGFRFLHVSTDEVYGDLSGTDPAFTEDTPYAPSSPYSASKAASDHMVRAWGRTYDLPVLITNCSNNYGPYQYPEKLIPVVIAKALSGDPIPVYGKGENIRDWLYVEDHAEALWQVFTKGQTGETYNIGGNCEKRNIDLVKEICVIMDETRPAGAPHESLISFVTDRPGHDRRYAINAAKIKTDLGWTPQTDFADGLRRTVQWYLDNQAWWQAASPVKGSHAA